MWCNCAARASSRVVDVTSRAPARPGPPPREPPSTCRPCCHTAMAPMRADANELVPLSPARRVEPGRAASLLAGIATSRGTADLAQQIWHSSLTGLRAVGLSRLQYQGRHGMGPAPQQANHMPRCKRGRACRARWARGSAACSAAGDSPSCDRGRARLRQAAGLHLRRGRPKAACQLTVRCRVPLGRACVLAGATPLPPTPVLCGESSAARLA
jgi:hypothetical protein